jgi:hypothetical protein
MSCLVEGSSQDVWRLVHEEKRPMKKVAAVLGISVYQAYEILAGERLRREDADLRRSVSGSE